LKIKVPSPVRITVGGVKPPFFLLKTVAEVNCAGGSKKCGRQVKNFVEHSAAIQAKNVETGISPASFLYRLRNQDQIIAATYHYIHRAISGFRLPVHFKETIESD